MLNANIRIMPEIPIGPVRKEVFGSFVEHLGRCVYEGIYEPDHPLADKRGFRTDVITAVKELGVTHVRYPGGNFVSGYRWEDGIGPIQARPRRLDLAWHSLEPNWVGIDDFMYWAKQVDMDVMMAANLGTRGVESALDLLEYCNHPGGTTLADERRANGSKSPYDINFWCLGNEMDGPWQLGHKTAHEYARIATETARAMRQYSKDLRLAACGSSSLDMPTYGEWERVVLEETYDEIDYISTHAYYAMEDDDLKSFLASATQMDKQIEGLIATADAIKASRDSSKEVNISFDEWNVWYQDRIESKLPEGDDWPVAPRLLEDNYSIADSVVVADLLGTLLNHADRVHSASLAQLVNVIAPIRTEPKGKVWKQTTFHPFAAIANSFSGRILSTSIDSPSYETAKYGQCPAVSCCASWDEENVAFTVLLVNRSTEESVQTKLETSGKDIDELMAITYSHTDPMWKASAQDDTSVLPSENTTVTHIENKFSIVLQPCSWTLVKGRTR